MNHKWQLARWLQKGYINSNLSLYRVKKLNIKQYEFFNNTI